jgi:dipeptidyl aminopeptidase/acylaminoacyl peptidase
MKNFSPEDLYLHQKVTDLHCIPALDLAAATVRSVDREKDGYVSCIWAFSMEGKPAFQLTRGPGEDKLPLWSPDGSQLAFVSDRAGGAPQLYVMRREGGEARQVANFELGVTQLRWGPDGNMIYVAAAVRVDPDLRGERGKPAKERPATAPEVCWRLPYKSDGVGYLLDREIHLFSVDVRAGQTVQLTDGPFDVQALEPSANGRHVAFTRTREGRFAHRMDLWVCDVDGGRQRQLTHDQATVTEPVWSPDGRWIAFCGAEKEGDGQNNLWLCEYPTGRVTAIGPEGLEVGDTENMYWSLDSQRLFLARAYRGRHEVVAISIPGGELEVLVDGHRQMGAFGYNGRHLVFSVDSPDQPSEVFAVPVNGGKERQVSQLNGWWKERAPLTIEEREFDVPDGKGGTETIQGYLLRATANEGPMPLLDDVHGGPASYALLDYDSNVYWQVLCSRGWGVLLLNAVGSSSFGREFCDRLSGKWGVLDLPQHIEALRQLQGEGICDDRLAIAGKSYGGYLASWAIGNCNDFRAAVVMSPVGNIETHYGTSDGGYYADPLYVDAGDGFDRVRARELSPLQYIEKAKTPALFMQGKDDERCPRCQSEELFVSLCRAGETPTELILYPGEPHSFLGEGKPSTRADAARRIVDWITRYCAVAPRKKDCTSEPQRVRSGATTTG